MVLTWWYRIVRNGFSKIAHEARATILLFQRLEDGQILHYDSIGARSASSDGALCHAAGVTIAWVLTLPIEDRAGYIVFDATRHSDASFSIGRLNST
jgi:hypothetical protein